MQSDLSDVVFNKNHKTDSASLGIISGIRLVLVSLVINVALVVIAIGESPNANFLPEVIRQIPGAAMFGLWVVSFGLGAYGTYLIISALGWAGYIGVFFIAALLIPFVKILALLFVTIKASSVIRFSNYKFSFFGKIEKRV